VLPTIYIKEVSLSLADEFATPNGEILAAAELRRDSLRWQPQLNADERRFGADEVGNGFHSVAAKSVSPLGDFALGKRSGDCIALNGEPRFQIACLFSFQE
jgi:hypothetical protein